ncbi:MAG TPA: HAD-IA family hydrolase [Acidimicrobiales bacterium]|nr:HAD-IA family hydrolase [Acidimicrobiales bacterium]
MVFEAVVFDFDGLLLETEGPVFQSWAEAYEEHGQELSLDAWLVTIGRVDHADPAEELERRLGRPLTQDERERRRSRRDELLMAMGPSAGAAECLAEARHLGLRTAVASSSAERWVVPHLERLGLSGYIDRFSCYDGTVPAKPWPDLYLRAVDMLGVAPRRAVAFEDSHNGLRAAKAAGLACVVVPSPMTATMDFALADRVIDRLGRPPLAQLLAELAPGREAVARPDGSAAG